MFNKTILIAVTLLSLSVALECTSGKLLLSITRNYYSYAEEECVKIYEGTDTTTIPVMTIQGVYGQNGLKLFELCVNPATHTLVMTDVFGDGWYGNSYIKFDVADVSLGTFKLSYGAYDTATLNLAGFISYGSLWKSTNVAQTGMEWTTQSQTWTESSTFPTITTITRYFRKTISLAEFATRRYISVTVKSNAGFVAYINGIVLLSFNMPSGTINSTTTALSETATAVERKINTLSGLFITSSAVEIAVEMHSSSATPSGAESFDVFVSFQGGSDIRRIDSEGTISSSALTTGAEGTGMIFDGNIYTQWVFPFASSVWVMWTFNNGRRELINKYSISNSESSPGRDPVAWKLYGSIDGTTFIQLDYQFNIIWTIRAETKTFTINNYIAYNVYKLELLSKSGTESSMQFSEWNLMITNLPIIAPGISYSQSSYSFYKNVDSIFLKPIITGYADWTMTGGFLPDGVTFDMESGIISGVALVSMPTTVFTISAKYYVNNQNYTTTLSLSFLSCDLPNNVLVSAIKTNALFIFESYQLINAADEVIINGEPTTSSMSTINKCIPVGVYTIKMSHSSGGQWVDGSYLKIKTIGENDSNTVFNSRLSVNGEATVVINLNYVLIPASHNMGIKYVIGSVPENWFTTTFDSSAWTTLTDSTRPAITHKIQLYRTTFDISTVIGFDGYELRVRARAGVVVYVNGVEVYRRYTASGTITIDSSATGGQDIPWWRSITGKMGNLVQGNNVLAVALINIASSAEFVDFDVSGRLIKESSQTARFWDYTTNGSSGSTNDLFDQNPNSIYRAAKSLNLFASISFSEARAELFNKYCIVTNSDNPSEDPREWKIEGSNSNVWVTIKTETDVFFENRNAPYCFYIPNAVTAYSSYRIILVKPAVDSATFYSLMQLNFYLEDLDHATVPELSFTPSVLVGYTGVPFPGVAANSPYYTTFTITPVLPTGLTLNSNTGAISGMIIKPYAAVIHTIKAINHLGTEKSATVSVAVEACAGDKVPFTLEFNMQSGAEKLSFDLKDVTTGTVVESRPYLVSYMTFTIPMCRFAQKYALVLKSTNTAGWGSNRVTVRLADGSELLTESLAAGVMSKEYNFNVKYEVAPQFSSWNYKVDGEAAPANWNTVIGAPSWPEASIGSFPVATGVTQYYYRKFTSADIVAYSALEISVVAKAGAIIYLNGKEKMRINLPNDDISSKTEALKTETVPTTFTVGDLVMGGSILEGQNILAFELHRYLTNEPVNTFDGSAILVLDNMYMVKDGQGTSNPSKDGKEGTAYLFDNNSMTKYYVEKICVGVTMTWTFNNNRREPINNYGIVNAGDCNIRHPSGFTLKGSNDGLTWTLLHSVTGVIFDSYYQQKRFDFYNEIAFNMYTLSVTECKNENLSGPSMWCSAGNIQMADFYLFSKRVEPDCKRDGDFPPAMDGYQSSAACPQYYEGFRTKLCTGTTFGPEFNQCTVMPPKGIQYDSDSITIILQKQMVPVVPNVIAREFIVSIFPNLPEGLTLDAKTGIISGIPISIQELKKYTVSLKNVKGTVKTFINIEVIEQPTNWILIGILAVVVVIIVVVIVATIVAVNKNKKKTVSKNVSKKSVKVSTRSKTPVVTKASIKV